MGRRRPRARRPRRRSSDDRRRHRGHPARRRPIRSSSAASSCTRRSPRSTGAGCSSSSGPGRPVRARPDRYRIAIERLTVQDIAVFFQEALAELPQLVADLSRGGRSSTSTAAAGAGWSRWPAASRRSSSSASSSSRIRSRGHGPTSTAAGLADRITIRHVSATRARGRGRVRPRLLPVRAPPAAGRAGCPAGGLGVAAPRRAAARPRLAAAVRTSTSSGRATGELIAGVQLDELYQGTGPRDARAVRGVVRGGRPAAARCSSTCRRAHRSSYVERD